MVISSQPKYKHLGCYKERLGDEALRYGPHSYGFVPMTCRQACRGYKYFALQDNGWCSCENDLRHATKHGRATNCPENRMGGRYANDLFQVDGLS